MSYHRSPLRVSVDHSDPESRVLPETLLEALRLLAEGQVPLPLKPGSKGQTYVPSWTAYRDRVPTEAEVRSWWERWPDAQLARIVPAGECVVDVDPRNGGDLSLAALEVEVRSVIEAAPRIWSGRGDGGFHAHLVLPEDLHAITKCEIAPGVDVLPPGSLEVVAPSLHVDTHKPYRWEGRGRPRPTLPGPLVPRPPRRDQTGTGTPSGTGRSGPPISAELLAEFEALWAVAGITLGAGERYYRCPWHEDRSPSLSVHRERGVWICHAGCGQGNVAELRRRLGVSVVIGSTKGLTLRATGASAAASLPIRTITRSCPHAVPVNYRHRTDPTRERIKTASCNNRKCEVCGPARADAMAEVIAATLEAEDLVLHSQLLEGHQLRAWKARVDRAGHRRKQFPAPGGRWRVFTTWEAEGTEVEDPVAAIREAHHAAVTAEPSGGRKVDGSRSWALTHKADAEAKRQNDPDWIPVGVPTASEEWAKGQAHKITGTKPLPLVEGGRVVGYEIRFTGATVAEVEAQREAWYRAAGILSPLAMAARRRQHQAQLLRVAQREAVAA